MAVFSPRSERAGVGATAPAGALRIRPGEADDLGFVREMLYEAAFWRPDARRPDLRARLRDAPELAVYIDEWGRPGDRALIACSADRPLGAAWFRMFTDDAHGYGFVDRATPELCVAVVAAYRGRGIGHTLLAAARAQAALDGIAQLSLSVEPDNPAVRLYARLGFRTIGTDRASLTMVAPTATTTVRDGDRR